jgi:hypothetical protein
MVLLHGGHELVGIDVPIRDGGVGGQWIKGHRAGQQKVDPDRPDARFWHAESEAKAGSRQLIRAENRVIAR